MATGQGGSFGIERDTIIIIAIVCIVGFLVVFFLFGMTLPASPTNNVDLAGSSLLGQMTVTSGIPANTTFSSPVQLTNFTNATLSMHLRVVGSGVECTSNLVDGTLIAPQGQRVINVNVKTTQDITSDVVIEIVGVKQ